MGILEGDIKTLPKANEAEQGIIFHKGGIVVSKDQGNFITTTVPLLQRFSMLRIPNGGWVISRTEGDQFVGAFTTYDEAIRWLDDKVQK